MRILVTGGAGYVGSVSVERFLAAGHRVVVVDDLSTGHRVAVPPDARLATIDYADEAAMAALLAEERVDAVLHCAARSLVGESILDPARYYRANVVGGVALLESARAAGVRRIVFSSTAAVYGISETTPITEDTPLRPINPYGETKRTFEGALRWYGDAYGFRSVALRYFNVAGATERLGEVHDPETHLIPKILRAAEGPARAATDGAAEGAARAATDGPARAATDGAARAATDGAVERKAEGAAGLTIYGTDYPTPDGTGIRDYIHVADLADAHLAALEATAPDDPRSGAPDAGSFTALNLGNGGGFSVFEVLHVAEAVVGQKIPHAIGPRRAGDPPVLVASAARAGEVLGWRPRRPTLEEMVGSAWAWRRRHPKGYAG